LICSKFVQRQRILAVTMDAMRLNAAKQRTMNANSSRKATMMSEKVLMGRRDALQHSRWVV
jgi:hypothetical protein